MSVIIRRKEILKKLQSADKPVSASTLAKQLGVSRQVIVQDISVLRAMKNDIISTHLGYIFQNSNVCSKEFYMYHDDDSTAEELNIIIDLGGTVKNVSIEHEFYGKVTVEMNISSRKDIEDFIALIRKKKHQNLSNSTGGYHYHLIEAVDEARLLLIEEQLKEHGFLAN